VIFEKEFVLNSISCNGLNLLIDNGKVFVNGEEIPFPKGLGASQSVSVSNGSICVNGYKYNPKKKRFKKKGLFR